MFAGDNRRGATIDKPINSVGRGRGIEIYLDDQLRIRPARRGARDTFRRLKS